MYFIQRFWNETDDSINSYIRHNRLIVISATFSLDAEGNECVTVAFKEGEHW